MSEGFAGLLDPTDGQSSAPTQEIGSSGVNIVGGYIVSNERNAKLKGRTRYQTFSEILANVGIVGAGVRGFRNLITRSKWTVQPAVMENEAEQAEADEVAAFVDDVLNDLDRPWSRVVARDAMFRFYGFAISEWVAKMREDGKIGFFDVAPRPQSTIERWDLDVHGRVKGCTQLNPRTNREVPLPRERIVYIVDDALSDSPEGMGLLRHLAEPHHRLNRYQELEAFGFEKDLKGIPIGRAPLSKLRNDPKLKAEDVQKAVKPLRDFVKSAIKNPELGFVFDSAPYRGTGENQAPTSVLEWSLELLTGSPTSAPDVHNAIERITREIAIILGVQHMLLGGDGSGSLALGRAFIDQFVILVDSALTELRQAYEHDLVDPLLTLNGIDAKFAPTLATEQVQHRDVEQLAGFLTDLATAGVVSQRGDPHVDEVFELVGLTAPEEDDSLDPPGGGPEPPLNPDRPDPAIDDDPSRDTPTEPSE